MKTRLLIVALMCLLVATVIFKVGYSFAEFAFIEECRINGKYTATDKTFIFRVIECKYIDNGN
jgi:hypothetical protein